MQDRNSIFELMEKAHALPWGKACSAMWVEAAKLAAESGEENLQAQCYLHLINAFAMSGESSRLVAPFLWLDKYRKRRPEEFDQEMQSAFGWQYKYVLGVLRDIPNASADQLLGTLEQMREYYQQRGDSLKSYYIRRHYAHWVLGQKQQAEEYAQKWETVLRRGEESEFDDCAGCDPMHLVALYISRDDVEQAVAAGEAGLADTGRYCDSQPESLFTAMLVPWLRIGQDEKAWPAHVRALQRNTQQSTYIEHFPEHFRYLGLSAEAGRPARWQRGVELFVRYLPWWCEAETPRVLLNLACSAAFFFHTYPDSEAIIEVSLPGSLLKWYNAPDLKNPTVAEIQSWCTDIALGIAAQFDARPGMSEPFVVEKIKADIFDVKPVPALPPEGEIPDVSGQFISEVIDYVLGGKPATPMAGELVAVDTRGEWREFSEADLVQAELDLDSQLPSIYGLRLGGLLLKDPTDAVESEDARMLLVQALDDLADVELDLAIQNATEAMHTPSSEPIGVRLQALYIIANAHLAAGRISEVLSSTRHCLNLAAALGLPMIRAQAAELMADALQIKCQWSELVEVASVALAAEGLDPACEPALALRRRLIQALDVLELDSDIVREAQILAGLLSDRQGKIKTLHYMVRALSRLGEHRQAVVIADQISELSRIEFETALQHASEKDIEVAAKNYADRLMAAILLRSEEPGSISDEQFWCIERDLEHRFQIVKEYLVPESENAQLVEALYCSDRGQFAFLFDRNEEAERWMSRSFELYLKAQRWTSAANCGLELAEHYMETGAAAEGYALAQQIRSFLKQNHYIHGSEYKRAELLISQYEAKK